MPASRPYSAVEAQALLAAVVAEKGRTLTIKEASVLIGVSDKTIRRAIHQGRLPAFMPPGARRDRPGRWGWSIKPEDLAAWWSTGWATKP